MAFTLNKVLNGTDIGSSLFDEEGAKLVEGIMKKAERGVGIHLPTDFICADTISPNANTMVVDESQGIPKDWIGLNVGPESSKAFADVVEPWNVQFASAKVGVTKMGIASLNMDAPNTAIGMTATVSIHIWILDI